MSETSKDILAHALQSLCAHFKPTPCFYQEHSCQILQELGFDGYPMKIISGEDSTRKPLFKIESMSDYTATSRNAFVALKKEAIHDLAWLRLNGHIGCM